MIRFGPAQGRFFPEKSWRDHDHDRKTNPDRSNLDFLFSTGS
jgi:hypothetical protein